MPVSILEPGIEAAISDQALTLYYSWFEPVAEGA